MFKVYIFNVTNPNEIMEGAMPKVKESEYKSFISVSDLLLGATKNIFFDSFQLVLMFISKNDFC